MNVVYQNPVCHPPRLLSAPQIPAGSTRAKAGKEWGWEGGGIRLAHRLPFCARARRRFELKQETARKNVQMLNSLQDL